MNGLFPAESVIRRVDGEGLLLLGGGRALLLQLAHPLVAQGVAEHSDFRTDPFGRLRRTLDASYAMVFGAREEAEQVAAAVRAVHGRVRGNGYDASDPALLMWVHATLVDTALSVHRRFVGTLTPADARRYYEESTLLAEMLGVPRDLQPRDLGEFRSYMRTMLATLEVSETARELARHVLHPRLPLVVGPLAEVARQLTIGLLPYPIRVQYGLGWDRRRKAALLAASAAARLVVPRVPPGVRRARLVA